MLNKKFYKKKLNVAEIKFFNLLKHNPDFDFILFPDKLENDLGIFPFLNEGDLLGKDKNLYIQAIKYIAKFHHLIKGFELNFIKFDANYYSRSLELTLKYAEKQLIFLPENKVKKLKDSIFRISIKKDILHDDFLPQNILVKDEKIKIIDWEHLRYGFAEHDIGRFLSDIDPKNPDYRKKYYPIEWQSELQEIYLKERYNLDNTYDMIEGKELIELGKMWNYLGPIEMCLKDGDIHSEWFLSNLQAFELD